MRQNSFPPDCFYIWQNQGLSVMGSPFLLAQATELNICFLDILNGQKAPGKFRCLLYVVDHPDRGRMSNSFLLRINCAETAFGYA